MEALGSVAYGGMATTVPVLDLRLLDAGPSGKAQVARTMCEAFEGPGMILLEHTGTEQGLVDEAARLSKAFFDLPVDQKGHQKPIEECLYPLDPSHTTYPGSRYAVQSEHESGAGRFLVNEHLNVREASQHPYELDSEYFTSPQGGLCFEPLPEGALSLFCSFGALLGLVGGSFPLLSLTYALTFR
jgi:isopenicillin N synthase-like dioxygenase